MYPLDPFDVAGLLARVTLSYRLMFTVEGECPMEMDHGIVRRDLRRACHGILHIFCHHRHRFASGSSGWSNLKA